MTEAKNFALVAKIFLDFFALLAKKEDMKLVIEKAAIRGLNRMQPKVARAIVEELKAVAADPFGHHLQVKRLRGVENGFRLRHGDWRAVYRLDRAADTMRVEWIGPRGGAYR